MFVIDASIVIAAVLQDEQNEYALDIMRRLNSENVHAPQHFLLETANILLVSVRRGRINADDRKEAAQLILALPLHVDIETSVLALGRISEVADQHSLTIYDAAYLELAMRLKCPLATLDRKLATAASRLGLLHPAIASAGLWA